MVLLEQPVLWWPLGDPCLLTHQMGYSQDAGPLGDPCLLTHQMGYFPDADLLVAELLDVKLLVLRQLAPLGFQLLEQLVQQLPGLLEQRSVQLQLVLALE